MTLFKKVPEEYLELGLEEEKPSEKLLIQVERMDSFADSERIQQRLRDGRILLVKVKDLKERDMNELKRAVAKVKKTCLALNGELAGLGEDWLLATTRRAKIHREEEE
jgi:SepF-like predicted cell division protein (DUF552 family)